MFKPSHLHICTSHLHIFTSSHLHILTSSHLLIFTSSHLHIFTSSHPHIFTSSHPHIPFLQHHFTGPASPKHVTFCFRIFPPSGTIDAQNDACRGSCAELPCWLHLPWPVQTRQRHRMLSSKPAPRHLVHGRCVSYLLTKDAPGNPFLHGHQRMTELAIEEHFGELRSQATNAQLSARAFFKACARSMLRASRGHKVIGEPTLAIGESRENIVPLFLATFSKSKIITILCSPVLSTLERTYKTMEKKCDYPSSDQITREQPTSWSDAPQSQISPHITNPSLYMPAPSTVLRFSLSSFKARISPHFPHLFLPQKISSSSANNHNPFLTQDHPHSSPHYYPIIISSFSQYSIQIPSFSHSSPTPTILPSKVSLSPPKPRWRPGNPRDLRPQRQERRQRRRQTRRRRPAASAGASAGEGLRQRDVGIGAEGRGGGVRGDQWGDTGALGFWWEIGGFGGDLKKYIYIYSCDLWWFFLDQTSGGF